MLCCHIQFQFTLSFKGFCARRAVCHLSRCCHFAALALSARSCGSPPTNCRLALFTCCAKFFLARLMNKATFNVGWTRNQPYIIPDLMGVRSCQMTIPILKMLPQAKPVPNQFISFPAATFCNIHHPEWQQLLVSSRPVC